MSQTEQLVMEVLAEINDHPRRDLTIPHGFKVKQVTAETVPNLFAPDLLSEDRITISLEVPGIYAYKPSPWGRRASLPTDPENLEALREAIRVGMRAHLRARECEWSVTPDELPEPYLPDGSPNGPPGEWSVTAVFDAH